MENMKIVKKVIKVKTKDATNCQLKIQMDVDKHVLRY